MQIEQSLLAYRDTPLVIVPAGASAGGHFRDFRFGIGPRLLRGAADQRGDPQSELQRRQVTIERGAQGLETIDPVRHAVQWFTPEQLDIGFGGSHPLGGVRRSAEIEPGMPAITASLYARDHGRIRDAEMLAGGGDALLGPQPSYQPHELLGAAIAMGLVALAIAIGGEVILAGDDVDPHPTSGQVIEGRGSGSELAGRQ